MFDRHKEKTILGFKLCQNNWCNLFHSDICDLGPNGSLAILYTQINSDRVYHVDSHHLKKRCPKPSAIL
jgi:hypothetical protein